MKTFLKVVLYLLLAILAIKLLPFLLVALAMVGGGFVVLATLAFGGIAAVAGVAVAVVAALLAAILAVVAVLSPIWIPVLAVVGVIALWRRSPRAARAVV